MGPHREAPADTARWDWLMCPGEAPYLLSVYQVVCLYKALDLSLAAASSAVSVLARDHFVVLMEGTMPRLVLPLPEWKERLMRWRPAYLELRKE